MQKSLWFAFTLIFLSAPGQAKTYGLILSGGGDPQNNHLRYYDNMVKMNEAFQASGISSDSITSLYADGKAGSANTVVSTKGAGNNLVSPPTVFNNGKGAVKGGANLESVNSYFDDLAKKVEPGDKLVFFITDHGDKNEGVVLWNGQKLSVTELQKQLQKLPTSVNIQVMTNMCYGGQLLGLSGPNICVSANSDSQNVTYSLPEKDPYAVSLANQIKANPKNSFSNLLSLAKADDMPQNTKHLTTVDQIIDQNFSRLSRQNVVQNQCTQSQSSLPKFVLQSHQIVQAANGVDGTKAYRLKRMNEIESQLKSARAEQNDLLSSIDSSQGAASKLSWKKLTPEQKENEWARSLRISAELKRNEDRINKQKNEIERLEKELTFVQRAEAAVFEKYQNARRCLDQPIGSP